MTTFKCVKGEDIPKKGTFKDVDQTEMVASHGPRLGTTGLGPCLALAAFGNDAKEQPMMGLWHIDAVQMCEITGTDDMRKLDGGLSVVAHFQEFLIGAGMKKESLKIHVIGGPKTGDHKAFKLLFKDKGEHPGRWDDYRLGQMNVPFKTKDGWNGTTDVYLEHPKTILMTFFCHVVFQYKC